MAKEDIRRALKEFIISLFFTYLAGAIFFSFGTKSLASFLSFPLLMLMMILAPFLSPSLFWYHAFTIAILLAAVMFVLAIPMRLLFKVPVLMLLYVLWFYLDFRSLLPLFMGSPN